jgi:hypothetical protein
MARAKRSSMAAMIAALLREMWMTPQSRYVAGGAGAAAAWIMAVPSGRPRGDGSSS